MAPTWDSAAYARYRPNYPAHLYDAILDFSGGQRREVAVDVGCGTGQVAAALAQRFTSVIGLDTSETQLANATRALNVEYRHGAAERTGLPSACADLVCAAAALHWFDRGQFYREARRVLRPGGTLAAWSYNAAPQFESSGASEAYLALRQRLWCYFDPRLQAHLIHGYAGCEPGPSDFGVVETQRIDMEWGTSVASLSGWARSWSPFHAFAVEHGQGAADELLAGFEADMISALGVGDRDAPVTVTLPLEVVLAKNPVPLEQG